MLPVSQASLSSLMNSMIRLCCSSMMDMPDSRSRVHSRYAMFFPFSSSYMCSRPEFEVSSRRHVERYLNCRQASKQNRGDIEFAFNEDEDMAPDSARLDLPQVLRHR